MANDIMSDRWFKLKLDKFIMDAGNSQLYTDPYGYHSRVTKPKPWYECDFLWSQVAESLAAGSQYTPDEVEEHLRHMVANAKLEALLDER